MAKLIMFIILAVLTVFFIVQNRKDVTVEFLFWEIVLRKYLLLIITLIVGIVLGWLGSKAKKKK